MSAQGALKSIRMLITAVALVASPAIAHAQAKPAVADSSSRSQRLSVVNNPAAADIAAILSNTEPSVFRISVKVFANCQPGILRPHILESLAIS